MRIRQPGRWGDLRLYDFHRKKRSRCCSSVVYQLRGKQTITAKERHAFPLTPSLTEFYHKKDVNNLPEYTKASLQRLRESANLTRKMAAPLLGISEETLRRIEDTRSTQQPTSGDLARMEDIYNARGLWYGYNRTNDDAFRDHLPGLPDYTEQGAILSYFAESRDATAMETEVLRDAADGRIDNPERRARLIKEVEDVAASALLLLQLLKGGSA